MLIMQGLARRVFSTQDKLPLSDAMHQLVDQLEAFIHIVTKVGPIDMLWHPARACLAATKHSSSFSYRWSNSLALVHWQCTSKGHSVDVVGWMGIGIGQLVVLTSSIFVKRSMFAWCDLVVPAARSWLRVLCVSVEWLQDHCN